MLKFAGGRRGAALLLAAGVTGAKEYQKKPESAPRGIRSAQDSAPSPATRSQKMNNSALAQPQDPLLRQRLPEKLLILKELFSGLQTVYDMLRRRNRRTTFANLKSAVEEASKRDSSAAASSGCYRSFRRSLQRVLPFLPQPPAGATVLATASSGLSRATVLSDSRRKRQEAPSPGPGKP